MPVNRAMLRQALTTVRLKARAEDPTRFLAQLYSSALSDGRENWAWIGTSSTSWFTSETWSERGGFH